MARKINNDQLKTSLVKTAGLLWGARKSPDELLGELFRDVQAARIYEDGKVFADLVPKKRIRAIQEEYRLAKMDPHFELREFIARHFYDVTQVVHKKEPFIPDPKETIDQHIGRLWEYLERRNRLDRGSLIALPHKYVVPGGRFNEQFYWDSYFVMLGLAAEGKWELVEGMIKNCAFMIRKYGYIPTANRTYFLSRSQPPVFALMVRLLAEHKGKKVIRDYVPLMVAEYRFWMRGRTRLADTDHRAYRRIVEMSDGTLLNRYYDNKVTPRPESLREDTEIATLSSRRLPSRLFLHLRAAAESGWDFSSRWLRDGKNLKTIHAADVIPVDLNSLLYILEETIAEGYSSIRHPFLVRRYRKKAAVRARAVNTYLWSKRASFYMDYNFHRGKRTKTMSLAGVFPLYAGIATPEQAKSVAERIESDFLKTGGVVTTLIETGQQWDRPNGWAPLQWITIEGLRRYGYDALADTIRDRWLQLNDQVFEQTHRLVEKYNVLGGDGLGGGGEYILQDGFGWTNGVYVALKKQKRQNIS